MYIYRQQHLSALCKMTSTITPEKSAQRSEEFSPSTVVAPTPTSCTASVPFLEEENQQDDDPIVIFAWINGNADEFLRRWEMRNAQVNQLNPSFYRPASLLQLYALLLEEFSRDIEGANVVGPACIQCVSSIAYGYVVGRMKDFESQPWVSTVVGGQLPGSAKLANLFVTASMHKFKPVKLGNLF